MFTINNNKDNNNYYSEGFVTFTFTYRATLETQ